MHTPIPIGDAHRECLAIVTSALGCAHDLGMPAEEAHLQTVELIARGSCSQCLMVAMSHLCAFLVGAAARLADMPVQDYWQHVAGDINAGLVQHEQEGGGQ